MVMNLLPLFLLSPDTLLRSARQSTASGNYDDALRAVDKALEKLTAKNGNLLETSYVDPEKASNAWSTKGNIFRSLGNYEAATNAFLLAHGLNALDSEALDFLTSQLLKRKDLSEEARDVYSDYLSETHHSEHHNVTKENERILEALSAPNWSRPKTIDFVAEWNSEIMYRRADLSWPYRHLGAIALYRGDYWDAISYLEEACRIMPADFSAHRKLAFAFYRTEEYESALTHLDTLTDKQLDRRTLLLRAHVLRALGNYTSAADDYKSAGKRASLSDDDRFCYIEVCINSGAFDEATAELGCIRDYEDDRWGFLSAIVDEAQGRDSEALVLLNELIFSEQFCGQATERILKLVAKNPHIIGAIEVLNTVPDLYRDSFYWTVKGNVFLSLGLIKDALEAWRSVYLPGDVLLQTIRLVGHHYFAKLYANGSDRQILRLIRRGLTHEMDCPEIAEIVVSSLTRRVFKNLNVKERHRRLLNDIDLVAMYFISADLEELNLLQALVHSAASDFEKAAAVFATLGPRLTSTEEIAFQMAKCMLRAGATTECLQLLRSIESEHPKAAAMRCALSALNGDWDAAAHYFLNGSPASKNDEKFKAAALFKASRWIELDRMNGSGQQVADYYRSARLLQAGERDAALRIVNSITTDYPARALCNQLIGWAHLQTAKDCERAGDRESAFNNVVDALLHWPQSTGPAARLHALDSKLIDALSQKANGPQVLAALVEARAARGRSADPAVCHNRALLHFCNGVRAANNNNFDRAIESWETSIGYIAAVLANETYMDEWVRQRLQVYEADDVVETQQVQNQVVQFYEDTFKQWGEELADRAQCLAAKKVTNLGLMLRAELTAARSLRKVGGFPLPDAPGEKVCVGPIFITMHGYEESFATYLKELNLNYLDAPDVASDEDPMAALMNLMDRWKEQEAAGAVDPADKVRLEKLFSVLRVSTILYDESKFDAALTHLPPLKKAVADGQHRRHDGLGAATRRRTLAQRSPAFARAGGNEDFQSLALTFEVDLLTALGEQDVASAEDKIQEGIEHWRQALTLAAYTENYLWVAGKVREVALGRADVLMDRNKSDQAINLLECVDELCGDEEVRSMLAKIHAVEGVKADRDGDRLTAITRLRKAATLNSQFLFARWNLANALLYLMDEVSHDQLLSRALVEEALDSIAVCRDLDPHNEQYLDTQLLASAKLNSLRIDLGEITVSDLSPEEFLALTLLRVSESRTQQESSQ